MSADKTNRREFLNRAAGTAAGLAAGSLMASRPARAVPANSRIVIGMMGTGGRGKWLLENELVKRPNLEIAYVCDANEPKAQAAAKMVEEQTGKKPKVVVDFRNILDDQSVNALFNVTPDHWHALGTILACQAGKDAYVEKPASHSLWEGRKMVEAARKYKRVVQIGSQNRSAPYCQEAVDYLRAGKLGGVHFVRVLNMKHRPAIGHKADAPTPPGLDTNLWLGPAPMRPYNPNRFSYAWHWFWDYSGGDIINDGVHQIDLARWLIGKDYPKAVAGTGGKFAFDDDQETPDTQVVTWEYDDMTMVFELTLWTPHMKKTAWEFRDTDGFPDWQFNATQIEIHGTKGMMKMGRHGGGWQAFDVDGKEMASAPGRHPHGPHLDNFFACVQSRDLPNADIEEGHRSTVLCHLGNISYRCGGRRLVFDGKTEQFVNDPEANRLLKRTYRDPWIVPEEV